MLKISLVREKICRKLRICLHLLKKSLRENFIFYAVLDDLPEYALCEMYPNTEFFLVRIQSECGKIRTRKNSVFGHFHAVILTT